MSLPGAGLTPASSFTEDRFAPPDGPPVILADDIDPDTGEFRTLVGSADPVDAAVQTLMRTQRGTGAAVIDLGQRLRQVRYVDETAATEADSLVREALKPLVDVLAIRIDEVKVTLIQDGGTIEVLYTNIPEEERKRQAFPLPGVSE